MYCRVRIPSSLAHGCALTPIVLSRRYSPTGAECLACVAGFYTGESSTATTCTSCDSGSYSIGLAVNCTLCPQGYYSPTRASSCSACEKGKYNDEEGASTCTSCAAGKFSDNSNATVCEACSPGRYQSATGSESCDGALAGYYVPDSGASSAKSCVHPSFSTAGATNCSLCVEDYYYHSGKACKDLDGENYESECEKEILEGGNCLRCPGLYPLHTHPISHSTLSYHACSRRRKVRRRWNNDRNALYQAGLLPLLDRRPSRLRVHVSKHVSGFGLHSIPDSSPECFPITDMDRNL